MAEPNGGRRNRLGRGLGALLDAHAPDSPDASDIRRIDVAEIETNPYQPRVEFSTEELEELAASIKTNGLLQPIVVRPAPGARPAGWQLVAGERRLRAVTRLGWADVPAIVREVDDRTLLVLALVENVQRERLAPLEEAAAYQQLADEFGFSQQQIADAVGRNRSTVANAVRLLKLPRAIRDLIDSERLSAGHARALLGVDDPDRMMKLARSAADEGWSVREVERHARAAGGRQRTGDRKSGKSAPRQDAAAKRLERALQRALGTSARIRDRRNGKGRIVIPFHSADDFERLYEQLTGRTVDDVV